MKLIAFSEIITFAGVFLSVCSAVIVLVNARKAIKELVAPYHQLEARVEKLKEYTERDFEHLQKQDEKWHLILKCEMQIMQHLIDGNHISKMKETKAEVENYLVKNF